MPITRNGEMSRYVLGLGEHQVLHDAPVRFFREKYNGMREACTVVVPHLVVHGNTQRGFDENGRTISVEMLLMRWLHQQE